MKYDEAEKMLKALQREGFTKEVDRETLLKALARTTNTTQVWRLMKDLEYLDVLGLVKIRAGGRIFEICLPANEELPA